MHVRKVTIVLVVLLLSLVAGAAMAQTNLPPITLNGGESITVQCASGRNLAVERSPDRKAALLTCRGQNQPEPTATPVTPEPTVQPTATAQPPMNEVDLFWHAPGIAHGDRPAHEHGDAPPQWLLDAGIRPTFNHVGGTPNENHAFYKHTAFKGWAGQFNGQDWYGVFHLDFNPAGHVSRFHSYQLWVRDATGAISAISGWLDFGVDNETGPQLVPQCGGDDSVRPIMNPPSVGCPIQFESWYARAGGSGGWAPDFGFNVNPNYFAGGDPLNPATWTSTGYVRNLERRIEFAWYLGGSGIRPAPRGEFYATQWGDIVSGPTDPVCGTQRTYGERTYTVACIRQYVAPTVQPMTFPGNSTGGTFPGSGVVLPN